MSLLNEIWTMLTDPVFWLFVIIGFVLFFAWIASWSGRNGPI